MSELIRRIFEKIWRLLPDNCETCKGKSGGVRGNENIINGKVVCDYCHSKMEAADD